MKITDLRVSALPGRMEWDYYETQVNDNVNGYNDEVIGKMEREAERSHKKYMRETVRSGRANLINIKRNHLDNLVAGQTIRVPDVEIVNADYEEFDGNDAERESISSSDSETFSYYNDMWGDSTDNCSYHGYDTTPLVSDDDDSDDDGNDDNDGDGDAGDMVMVNDTTTLNWIIYIFQNTFLAQRIITQQAINYPKWW